MPSHVIRTFSYDQNDRRLTIRFVSGKVYIYEDVHAETVDGLKAAASKGSYFNEFIRDQFAFARKRGESG